MLRLLNNIAVSKAGSLKVILFFIALTVLLTVVVVYAWEQVMMSPLYSYFREQYPGPEYADYRWRIAQRIEHFVISIIVDTIIVTLLLRLVDKQQRKLRESEKRYRALFEQAGDAIGVVRASDHQLVDVNHKFGEILGYKLDSLIGKHICELFVDGIRNEPVDAIPEAPGCKPADGFPIPVSGGETEIEIHTASGSALPVSVSCSSFSTREESLYILIIRDLTERKRLEREREDMQRQLFQTSKLASIGELSAGVAHEINNPLNCIVNFAQLLKDNNVARNESEDYMVNGIIEEGERMAKIVRDLLTFARQEGPSQPALVELAGVLDNSFSLFGHQLEKDGIRVEVDLPSDVQPVLADSSRLRQVFVNMISNAHHALHKKEGERLLRVRARNLEGGARKVRIEFYDTGVGIKPENLDKVFDPFFTTRRDSGGTGLGLSLSFGIVHDYGGTIAVDSQEGSYTRFIIDLPAAASEEAEYAESTAGRRRA